MTGSSRAKWVGATLLSWTPMACGPSVGEGSTSEGSGTAAATSTGARTTTTTLPADGTTSASAGPTTDISTGSPPVDVPDDDTFGCRPVWASLGCAQPDHGPGIMATTPLGDFPSTFAVFGADMGCGGCVDSANVATVVFADDVDVLAELTPGLGVDETLTLEFVFGAFEGPLGRPVMAQMTANRDGSSEQILEAQVIIENFPDIDDLAEPYDPETAFELSGSVMVNTGDWTVAGEFSAAYCPDINLLAICE